MRQNQKMRPVRAQWLQELPPQQNGGLERKGAWEGRGRRAARVRAQAAQNARSG